MPDIPSMDCPFCGRVLSIENDYDAKQNRYHCPTCFETHAEARAGWLPIPRVVKHAPAVDGRSPTRVLDGDPMFARNANGELVTRDRTCECGRAFQQRLLSARFLEIVERAGVGALAALTRTIPGYFIPVHCPPCERRDLGHQARIDATRTIEPKRDWTDAAD